MKPFVFITRKLPDEIVRPLRKSYEVEMWHEEMEAVPRRVLLEKAGRADALLTVVSDQVDEEIFRLGGKLKVVANMAVGYDNVDVNAASSYGVAVCNTPDVLTDTTADLAFGLLIATARRMIEASTIIRNEEWKSWAPLFLAGTDIHHKTIGIVGMGNIGTAVAKRAKGFDMEVLYHNRSRHHQAEEQLGAIYCSLDDLLGRADFVVCLAPLTEETKGMFGREQFKKMKKEAIFINAGRGPVVKEDDLYAALKDGEIAAAGLDVFDQEPLPPSHPLLTLPNVTALPHIGSATKETRYKMMGLCIENIAAVLQGEAPKTLVNQEWLQRKSPR